MQSSPSITPSSAINYLDAITSNRIFEFTVVAVIILSALLTGVKTYAIPANVMQLLAWLDYSITLFFLIEISLRFLAEPNKWRFFQKGLEYL
jgi:voltage-gated sodium channel